MVRVQNFEFVYDKFMCSGEITILVEHKVIPHLSHHFSRKELYRGCLTLSAIIR